MSSREPVPLQSPSGRVYASLRASLLRGAVRPGQPLRPQELATEHGVSLAVVREALLRLVAEDLVVRSTNRGFSVPAVDSHTWQQITVARLAIEPVMLRMAIESADLEWESHVRAVHHRLAGTAAFEQVGDAHYSDAWGEAHRRFHRALLEGCRNDVLLDMFDRLWTRSELVRRWSTVEAPERDGAGEHRAIEAAALARDATLACDLLIKHLTLTTDALQGDRTRP